MSCEVLRVGDRELEAMQRAALVPRVDQRAAAMNDRAARKPNAHRREPRDSGALHGFASDHSAHAPQRPQAPI